MTSYDLIRYAADGHAGEQGDGDVVATGTLEECRAAVADLVDGPVQAMRWGGTDDDVEAYHESMDEGCGGWAIRPAVDTQRA